jgi:hypothetical protein
VPAVTVDADRQGQALDRARAVGGEGLLHLHGLQHDDEVAFGHGVAVEVLHDLLVNATTHRPLDTMPLS